MEPRLLTEKEAAAYLRLPISTVRGLSVGQVRLGARRRYDRVALDAYLDRLAGLQASEMIGATAADAELDRFIADHPDAAGRPQGQTRQGKPRL